MLTRFIFIILIIITALVVDCTISRQLHFVAMWCYRKSKVFSLLLLSILLGHAAALFEGCDHTYNLNPGYSYLESPYYPNNYPAGTSCRYKFTAPIDYSIQLNCTINLDKGANACSTEYFYVATDGDLLLRGSEQFCGQGSFVRQSLFRTLVVAYASHGSWGRFRCSLYTAPQPCDCGWSVNTRITNGQQAGLNEFPFIAALKDLTSSLPAFCSASIITHRYLVTAAHCTRLQPNPANIQVKVGDHQLSSTSESMYAAVYGVQQIIENPGYTSDPVENDIAILKTNTDIEWSRGVGPICLPPANQAYTYNYVDVAGWGTTSFAGPTSDVLLKVQLMVIDNSNCQQAYPDITIKPSQVCTYDYTGSGRDSCQYDSGGPVVLRYSRMFLLGCISFGNVCGQGGYATGVNTRIPYFLSWIQQTVSYTTCPKAMS